MKTLFFLHDCQLKLINSTFDNHVFLDLSRSKRGKRLRIGEYGNHESLHISTETPEKLEIKSDKETPSGHAVDVSIPGVANFVLRGQYGITIASMTILAVFVVERFFTLSMCLAKRQIPQQDRPR